MVIGAVAAGAVVHNRAEQQQHAQAHQAEEAKKKDEREYEAKLKEQEKKHEAELKAVQGQYYNNPAQATQAVQSPLAAFAPPPGHAPPSLPPPARALVLANYIAASPTELSVREGEYVVIVRADPSGWTEVLNGAGNKGYVPATFLRVTA